MLRKPVPAGASKIQAVINPLLNVGGPEAKFAVFQVATAQFRSSPGDVVRCPRIQAAIGSEVVLKKVLLLGGHRFTVVGRPFIEGAVVVADVEEQKRAQPVVHYRNPKMQKHMMWREYHSEITVLRVKRIEFEPIIVGELDKYTGSLLPAEEFQADKPPNPVFTARSPILGDQHHVPRR
jgi:large subunit ribosomal protein L21